MKHLPQLKFTKVFTFCVLLLSATVQGNSLLNLCNENLDRKVFASFMKQVGSGAGWQSTGWYSVDQGKCRDIDLGKYEGKVYLFANDEFRETTWGESEVMFCVHSTDAFTINNADTVPCNSPGLMKVNSDEVSVKEGSTRYTFRRNFAEVNFCNLNQSISIFASFAKKLDKGLQSRGWYSIPAKECRMVTIGKYTGNIQYYGEYNGGQLAWGTGPEKFCVNRTQAFQLEEAGDETKCAESTMKMVLSSTAAVSAGVTTINFEAAVLKTILKLCNNTTDKTIYSTYAIAMQSGLLRSIGWIGLTPTQCKDIDLGTYQGTTYIYGEHQGGSVYWGSGPVNVCVDKANAFQFEDATNAGLCNSNIKNKMVPTFQFNVGSGTNTFSFEP